MSHPTPAGPPLFIGGLMKSGTSLARKLLSRHPALFGGLETHWFSPEFQAGWDDPQSRRVQWMAQFFDVPPEALAALQAESIGPLDFFDRFMWWCAARAGKGRWIEKTPGNILHLDTLRAQWPQAQVVHLVRDYRDVWASWRRNQKGSLEDFIAAAQAAADALAPHLEAPWLRALSYEALVLEPEATLRGLTDFVGVPWVPGLERYEGDDADLRKVREVTGRESPTTRSLARPLFTDSVGQWRAALPPAEAEAIVGRLGAAAALLGVELAP